MQEFCMPDVCMEIVEHDRISSLPDEVLTHILSFLSTKEAVYTSVLSKTWRKIWATVPILNFNSCEFLMDDLDDDEGRKSGARFERFVRGVLDNRESTNLDIVHYSRQIHWSESLVSMEWLDRVALLMPRVIHIDIDGNFYEVDLPDLIFSCASLQRLVMKFCYDCIRPIIKPMSIYLPSLKVLRLNRVELLYDFAQILFMGCPSLESLYLCFCALHFSSISSMKLKKLRLYACDHQYEEIQISCPDLVSLFITCGEENFLGISLNDMTSLVNATVKLHYYDYGDEVPVLNLFGLSNVTNLKLRLDYPKLKGQLEKDILNWRKFNNLKKLCIGIWNIRCEIYLIACFLKRSPNLKELTLELFASPGNIQQEPRQEVLGDVSFQHEYLETVKIKCWSNSEWASNMIKTLDKYVKNIGNIIIR